MMMMIIIRVVIKVMKVVILKVLIEDEVISDNKRKIRSLDDHRQVNHNICLSLDNTHETEQSKEERKTKTNHTVCLSPLSETRNREKQQRLTQPDCNRSATDYHTLKYTH